MLTDCMLRPQLFGSMLILARDDTSLYTLAIQQVLRACRLALHTMLFPFVKSEGGRWDVRKKMW